MSRLFIIGAGFSKALADAPLANGFIKAIYDETLNQDMKYQHAGEWRSDRTAFQKLLKHFHESTTKLVESLEQRTEMRMGVLCAHPNIAKRTSHIAKRVGQIKVGEIA